MHTCWSANANPHMWKYVTYCGWFSIFPTRHTTLSCWCLFCKSIHFTHILRIWHRLFRVCVCVCVRQLTPRLQSVEWRCQWTAQHFPHTPACLWFCVGGLTGRQLCRKTCFHVSAEHGVEFKMGNTLCILLFFFYSCGFQGTYMNISQRWFCPRT